MSKVVTIQLVWKYSPENYLEDGFSIPFKEGQLDINKGVAIATINAEHYLLDSDLQQLQENLALKIKSKLQAVLIFSTHKSFEMSGVARTDSREDGSKHYHLKAASANICVSPQVNDQIIKDKNGNVVLDTKKNRADKLALISSRIEKHMKNSNVTLNQLLNSYQNSVNDPDNEFVHLYEIRDALSREFGSNKRAQVVLGVGSDEWKEIGKLANDIPVKQGRHRGKKSALRDAELSELKRARAISRRLIERYLEFLENKEL